MDNKQSLANFACRLCGGADLYFYYSLGNQGQCKYYKCPTCQLVNYDLSGGLDQEQYTSTFIDPTDDNEKWNLNKDQSFDFITRNVKEKGSFLDVGCGMGRMLYVAKRQGWQVKGLELSASMARRVSEVLDIEVVAGDFLEGKPFRGEQFDVVSLRHVIEHLPDSLGAVERLGDLVRPGGYLLLEMPNIEALDKRLKRAIVRRGWHKRKFPDDFKAGHCNEFCKESMAYLMDRSGFEMIHWETYSMKPLANFIYNRIHVGNKARMLARKRPKASAWTGIARSGDAPLIS
jgi:SAM-dependent methyltransferase